MLPKASSKCHRGSTSTSTTTGDTFLPVLMGTPRCTRVTPGLLQGYATVRLAQLAQA